MEQKETTVMASQPCPEFPGSFRFEFDGVNRILLLRLKGRMTEEILREIYTEGGRYWTATMPNAAIVDCSPVTETPFRPTISGHWQGGNLCRAPSVGRALSSPRQHSNTVWPACFSWAASMSDLLQWYTQWTKRSRNWAFSPLTLSRWSALLIEALKTAGKCH